MQKAYQKCHSHAYSFSSWRLINFGFIYLAWDSFEFLILCLSLIGFLTSQSLSFHILSLLCCPYHLFLNSNKHMLDVSTMSPLLSFFLLYFPSFFSPCYVLEGISDLPFSSLTLFLVGSDLNLSHFKFGFYNFFVSEFHFEIFYQICCVTFYSLQLYSKYLNFKEL